MEQEISRIYIKDFFIINIPAFLFLLLVPIGFVSYFLLNQPIFNYMAIPFVVWGVSGCVLLLADYFNRKKRLYLRLLQLNENRDPLTHSVYLRSTVCGLAILWALYVRNNQYYRRESV